MQTRYDPATDALYVGFAEAAIVESEEVHPGVTLDFDADGRIVAIEVLDASERLSGGRVADRTADALESASSGAAHHPRKRIDAGRLRSLTATIAQRDDAAFMRTMRDGDRY
jgi:uncharacterized protein YuzE